MDILIMLGKFILSLSILIILHECGHFFPARWFKTKVEKFYLFFDPGFSLFKMKKGDTEYGIGWLPLGGYVKIAGMIDESFDQEQMAGPPQPWEFRSKKAWQRLIIMLGGVTVNFILGIVLFGMIYFVWGEKFLPNENAKYGIVVGELGEQLGLQNGDKIISVGDFEIEKFGDADVLRHIIVDQVQSLKIERDGREIDLDLPDEFAKELTKFENKDKSIYSIRTPTVIGALAEDMAGAKAGLQVDDELISIDGNYTPYYDQFSKVAKASANKEVSIGVLRGGDSLAFNVALDSIGRVGFLTYGANHFFDIASKEYGATEAMSEGWSRSMNFYADQFKAFGKMFKGEIEAKESLGGPVMIATMFKGPNPNEWNWQHFWNLTAMLSLILALMNMLPIPALDGGHVMFLVYEVLTGRKPSDKVVEYATLAGFVLLMGLMVLIVGNDISRYF